MKKLLLNLFAPLLFLSTLPLTGQIFENGPCIVNGPIELIENGSFDGEPA